jgi:hypothetical protein
MKKLAFILCSALALALAGVAIASTTYHGTFNDGGTGCGAVFTPAPAGSIGGTWNLNVKQGGEAEISLNIFRDGKEQANWGFVNWSPAADNDPGTLYHYTAVVSPTLTLDVSYTPSTDRFVFQAFHPSSCIGEFHADHVVITGSADRGGS